MHNIVVIIDIDVWGIVIITNIFVDYGYLRSIIAKVRSKYTF